MISESGELGSPLGHLAWTLLHAAPVLSVSVVLSWCLKFVSFLPALLPAPSLEGSLHFTVLNGLDGGIVSGKAEPRHHLVCALVIGASVYKDHS